MQKTDALLGDGASRPSFGNNRVPLLLQTVKHFAHLGLREGEAAPPRFPDNALPANAPSFPVRPEENLQKNHTGI